MKKSTGCFSKNERESHTHRESPRKPTHQQIMKRRSVKETCWEEEHVKIQITLKTELAVQWWRNLPVSPAGDPHALNDVHYYLEWENEEEKEETEGAVRSAMQDKRKDYRWDDAALFMLWDFGLFCFHNVIFQTRGKKASKIHICIYTSVYLITLCASVDTYL